MRVEVNVNTHFRLHLVPSRWHLHQTTLSPGLGTSAVVCAHLVSDIHIQNTANPCEKPLGQDVAQTSHHHYNSMPGQSHPDPRLHPHPHSIACRCGCHGQGLPHPSAPQPAFIPNVGEAISNPIRAIRTTRILEWPSP